MNNESPTNGHVVKSEITSPEHYQLCWVDSGKAYFTDADDFDHLIHDDWDDGYDTAALYGVDDPHSVVILIYDGPVQRKNYEHSPENIIAGEMEWLASERNFADQQVSISAKCRLDTFVKLVQRAGAQVYLPADEVKQ